MPAARNTATKPSTSNRARVSNDPTYLAGHSGRTPAGRRRRDLAKFYIDALGGTDKITPVQAGDIRRAAELMALAEEMRGKALTEGAGTIDISALVRLEGQAARAVRALGIKPGGNAAKPMSLGDYLAAKQAEKAAEAGNGGAA